MRASRPICNPPALQDFLAQADRLLERLRSMDEPWSPGLVEAFEQLERLTAALPLMTDEYCFAANWLAEARRCARSGEIGAACYQIAMVGKKLAQPAG